MDGSALLILGGVGVGAGVVLVQMVGRTWTGVHTTILVVAVAIALIASSVTAAALIWNSVHRRIVSVPLPDIAPARDILDIQARAARRDTAEMAAAGGALRLMDRLGQARPPVPISMDIDGEFGSPPS